MHFQHKKLLNNEMITVGEMRRRNLRLKKSTDEMLQHPKQVRTESKKVKLTSCIIRWWYIVMAEW